MRKVLVIAFLFAIAICMVTGTATLDDPDICLNATSFIYLYYNEDCTGEFQYGCGFSRSSTYDNINVIDVNSVRVLGTYRIEWVNELNQTFNFWTIGFPPNGTDCIEKSDMELPNANDYKYNISHAFYSDTQPSELFFMVEPNFQGAFHWVPSDQRGQFSPWPVTARSYIHHSNDAWIVYSGREYSGSEECLCPSKSFPNGTSLPNPKEAQHRVRNINITVGSVKRDNTEWCLCGHGSKLVSNFLVFILSLIFIRVINN